MGSYLSIVNDTPYTWECRLGVDEAALKIAGYIIAAVAAVATTLATAGIAGAIAVSVTTGGVVSVIGVSTAAVATAAHAASIAGVYIGAIGAVSTFGLEVAKGMSQTLEAKRFKRIQPGSAHRFGKMTLSLWQQGTCVRTEIVNQRVARTHVLYMRPIFSGAKERSNANYSITYWVNKRGTETKLIKAVTT
ncbi:hypothetical protein P43SY_000309 [Pythium insidiosum]|uniref:Uncharacterized protein n=1 Tax=Pythium insidiosum TaxID=114742 RepID=A0AAD5M285_PYTIN|nr:hypothetical protein P43SY_000309 [Pythium insidiosum]